jgi:hypothetical protein
MAWSGSQFGQRVIKRLAGILRAGGRRPAQSRGEQSESEKSGKSAKAFQFGFLQQEF